MENRLITPKEAAAYLGVSRRRVLKLPIKRVRLGARTIRYRLADLDDYARKASQ